MGSPGYGNDFGKGGYGPPPGSAWPDRYGAPPSQGYGPPSGQYGPPPGGYANGGYPPGPLGGYGPPPSYGSNGGYGPPPGYGDKGGYGPPPSQGYGGWGGPPPGYGSGPPSYGDKGKGGYGPSPGYGDKGGYGPPPNQGYGPPPIQGYGGWGDPPPPDRGGYGGPPASQGYGGWGDPPPGPGFDQSRRRSRSRSPLRYTGPPPAEATPGPPLERHKDAQRDSRPAWMTKGVGVGTEMFGETKGDLVKPGMTASQLEEIEKRGLGDGPDPFGDVFKETKNAPPSVPGQELSAGTPYQQRAPLPDQSEIARAAGIQSAASPPAQLPPPGAVLRGTMLSDNGKFGFIKQDDSDVNMFIMPGCCQAFGTGLPPIGTRLQYTVCTDPKTGRARVDVANPVW